MIKRCEEYPDGHLPEGVLALTAGADVQKDRIEVTVFGWGIAEECWGIEHRTLYGDPEKLEIWQELDDFLNKKWRAKNGTIMRINCAAIDSGWSTRNVYAFTKPRQPRRIYAVKGSSRSGAPLVTKRVVKMGRTTVFFVGTDTAKDAIFARLRLEEAGPRYIHFPHGEGFDEEYFRQLTAEEIRTRMKNGFPIRYWKKIRDRNECLDTMVYALAALDILNPNFERLAENMVKEEPEPEDPNPVPTNLKEPKKPKPKPRGGGFVDSWR
jgi:phage terminase large subunit GpA-like protein